MNKPFYFLLFSLVMLLTTGCGSSSQVIYLQGAEKISIQENEVTYDLRIKKDDMLSIQVFCRESELAAPFNFTNTTPSPSGDINKGFLVNSQGDIDYPVFGKIHAQGLTCTQLSDTIRNLLIHEGYIQQPTVNVNIINFKVSILGEVLRPGIFNVPSERITIFEAIAQSGDLSIFGKRKVVKLLREEGGLQKVFIIDLTDPQLINTSFYYLQQNDLIYVEPNNTKISQRNINPWITTGVSVLNFLMTLGLYIFK